MAKLEDVKAGDRVWICKRNHRLERDERINLHTVGRVTSKKFATTQNPKELVLKENGRSDRISPYYFSSIASPMEVEGWEIIQAKKKADQDQAEAQQQAAHKERCERIQNLAQWLIEAGLRVGVKGDVAIIEANGRCYRVTEEE
jgi:hypothetical protein